MKEKVLAIVLQNALDFKGNIHEKAVLGLVLRQYPDMKKNVRKVLQEINGIVKEIEGKDLKDVEIQLKELQHKKPNLFESKKEEKVVKGILKPLPNAEHGNVVVRIAPSPSGPLHIGHAYGVSLNYEYAKMYDGKFFLRIEDTNPENLYEPAYGLIEKDAQWLTDNHVSDVIIQSSRLGIYYDYAEKLVDMGNAYVCECNVDLFREMKAKGKICSCRGKDVQEQQTRYAKMFNGYAEGEAVLRLKTNIKDKNPAMRDFAIMRVNEHVHPKTGKEQRVWPLMVFSVAVDDHEMGVTHVMNGKEHADNGKKESIIMEFFGWDVPEYKHWGRINFVGFKVSASKTRLAIEQGDYTGWDDIRLPFLPALRRRGYQPEAFRKFATKIGLSLNDKTVSMEEFWKMVNAFNKEIVEPIANRYFFVDDPVRIQLEKDDEMDDTSDLKIDVKIPLHQEDLTRGKRKLEFTGDVFISKNDELEEYKVHRLMDCCNFRVEGKKFIIIPGDINNYRNAQNKGKIIHWVPFKNHIKCETMLEDRTLVQGVGEQGLASVKVGEIIQLERRYFARVDSIDSKTKKIQFWYLHK